MATRYDGRILENMVDQGVDVAIAHLASLRDPDRPPCTLAELKSKILSGDIVLTAILEKAARSAFAAPDFIAFETRAAFATRTGVPPQTVDRLVRRLGFKRFRDFRAVFRAHLSQIPVNDPRRRLGGKHVYRHRPYFLHSFELKPQDAMSA